MSQTALHPWQVSGAAQTGRYNGVETALSFGSPANELAALRSASGIFALSWRAQINITGKDRVRWLHNMVTNTVRDLAVNRGNYNFVLNAQGRILGDLYIFNRGESILLETDSGQIETMVNTLKRFIIMDKVELVPAAPELTALAVCGPQAEKILASTSIDASGMAPLEVREFTVDGAACMLITGPKKKPGWFEIWLNMPEAQNLWQKLIASGAQPVGTDAVEMWRVLHGIPNYGQDIRDSDLPQETSQADALHFTKGCYIGQEIVERIRSRGHVHRTFTGFEFPGTVPVLEKTEADRRAPAELTSLASIPVPGGERHIGLGYVRREVITPDAEIDLNGVAARVVELPFEI
ncbi:MAG TPA: folate-binding protein [Candidatus Sulfotelmatobacter sp.]|nr:folate-binding protein [Candidatus Sulfotelmatobacter sp.]